MSKYIPSLSRHLTQRRARVISVESMQRLSNHFGPEHVALELAGVTRDDIQPGDIIRIVPHAPQASREPDGSEVRAPEGAPAAGAKAG